MNETYRDGQEEVRLEDVQDAVSGLEGQSVPPIAGDGLVAAPSPHCLMPDSLISTQFAYQTAKSSRIEICILEDGRAFIF